MRFIYNVIKLNQIIKSHRIKYVGVLFCHLLGIRHLFLRIDPVEACNLKCLMCRTYGNEEYRNNHNGSFTLYQMERIAYLFFSRAMHVTFGCIAEPTLHNDLSRMVMLAKKYKVPYVSVVSNGQLYTVPRILELVDSGLDELIISVHGVTKETYERFMIGASYEGLHNLLSNITTLRCSGKFKRCKIRINYVVNSENVNELQQFFKVFGSYIFDILQIRPLIEGNFHDTLKFSDLHGYDQIMPAIRDECSHRCIMLLSQDQQIQKNCSGYQALLMPAIFRYISPGLVWNNEFNWQQETYRDFCRKNHFTRSLMHAILSTPEELLQRVDPEFKNSLNYSVS